MSPKRSSAPAPPPRPDASSVLGKRSRDLLTLTKPGIVGMVSVSAGAAFALASDGAVGRAVSAMAGTALAAGGSGALNMWLESVPDALMRRTRDRPLPAGRMSTTFAFSLGIVLSAAGVGWLFFAFGWMPAALCLATVLLYIAGYTPMKSRSSAGLYVGAVAGALPPLVGWSAAAGSLTLGAWLLFALLFVWQLPHFLALAWSHREDYAKAGMRFPPVSDPSGRTTRLHVAAWTVALAAVSLAPAAAGELASSWALVATAASAVAFAALASPFVLAPDSPRARRLFFASIAYLPVVLTIRVLDRAFL